MARPQHNQRQHKPAGQGRDAPLGYANLTIRGGAYLEMSAA